MQHTIVMCMEACYLDANVLVYCKNEESSFFGRATELMDRLISNEFQLCVSSLVLDEFLYAVLCEMRLRGAQDFALLKKTFHETLQIPTLTMIHPPQSQEVHLHVVDLMEQFRLHPRDAYHLFTMQSHGIRRFATFDKDFERVFGAGVLERFE